METLIVHPDSKEQLDAIKAFMEALKISFEAEDDGDYSPEFIAQIKKGREQVKNGETRTVNINDL